MSIMVKMRFNRKKGRIASRIIVCVPQRALVDRPPWSVFYCKRTCDSSALAKKRWIALCLSSLRPIAVSLVALDAGEAARAGCRYEGRGDGVVVDEDGVVMS